MVRVESRGQAKYAMHSNQLKNTHAEQKHEERKKHDDDDENSGDSDNHKKP